MKTCTLPFSEGYAQRVVAPKVSACPKVMTLPKAEVVRIEPGSQTITLHCQVGRVWITQTGNSRDVILSAGEYCTLRDEGLILAEAIDAPEAMLEVHLQTEEAQGRFLPFA